MEKLRVFEAFCGYGSQSIALENIGVPHKVVAISDIDADVLISYGAIRGDLNRESDLTIDEIKEWLMARNIGWDFQKQKSSIPRMKKDKLIKLYNSCIDNNCLGDVSIIDPNNIPSHDLFTYSFPCTDISLAGRQEGLTRGSGTRSGLLWECEKIIAAKKPKYLLMENVKNLVGKKFKAEFDTWCEWLSEQGYSNYWKVLNAKDFGVPQNRERVFMISILGEHDEYEFPEKFPLEIRLRDVLEDEVEDKYYIDNEASNRLLGQLKDKHVNNEKIISVGNVNPSGNGMNGNVIDSGGLAATVTTNKGEGQKIVIDKSINNPKEIDNANCITSREDRGISNRQGEGTAVLEKIVCEQRCDEGLRFFKGDVCGTIRAIQTRVDKRVIECGAIRGRYEEDGSIVQKLELNGEDNTNTITTVQKDNMIVEQAILRAERTEYGKEIRKAYENGEIEEKIGNMREYKPRQDGISNTITTVQKDNMLFEKTDSLNMVGMLDIKGNEQIRRVYGDDGISPTLNTMQGGNRQPKAMTNYRIRKLTPKECWRLMGMKDEHFQKCVDAEISNSQLYKQAGNSIVVDVLEYIFKQLFKEYIVEPSQ